MASLLFHKVVFSRVKDKLGYALLSSEVDDDHEGEKYVVQMLDVSELVADVNDSEPGAAPNDNEKEAETPPDGSSSS